MIDSQTTRRARLRPDMAQDKRCDEIHPSARHYELAREYEAIKAGFTFGLIAAGIVALVHFWPAIVDAVTWKAVAL